MTTNERLNDLFISINYNNREIDGIENLKSSLEKEYHFQIRPKWTPSCSEGVELWMTIFINSGIGDFLKNIVIPGITWDLIKYAGKKYVFTPLFNALENLDKDNKDTWGGLNMQTMKFQFDDCEIIIKELNNNFTSIVPSVFNEITKKIPYFAREVGTDVIKIELPYNRETEYVSIETFLCKWKVTFQTNHPIMIYDFQHNELKDLLPSS